MNFGPPSAADLFLQHKRARERRQNAELFEGSTRNSERNAIRGYRRFISNERGSCDGLPRARSLSPEAQRACAQLALQSRLLLLLTALTAAQRQNVNVMNTFNRR